MQLAKMVMRIRYSKGFHSTILIQNFLSGFFRVRQYKALGALSVTGLPMGLFRSFDIVAPAKAACQALDNGFSRSLITLLVVRTLFVRLRAAPAAPAAEVGWLLLTMPLPLGGWMDTGANVVSLDGCCSKGGADGG